MATSTTGGISLGDCVLSVVVDLTNANATLNQFASDLPGKLKPSADAASAVGQSFEKVGTAAGAAGAAASEAVGNIQSMANSLKAEGLSAQDVASALTNLGFKQKDANAAAGIGATVIAAEDAALKSVAKSAPVTGAAIENAATRGGNSMLGLQIKTQAVDEAIGIRLPRGITRFLASLPGIGGALDIAFSASVVFFLIEAIATLAKKIEDFELRTQAINAAWRDFGDASAAASRSAALGLAEADAAMKGVDLSVKLASDLMKNLSRDASDATRVVKEMGDSLVKALTASAVSKFNPMSWWNDNSREDAKAADLFFKTLTSDVERLGSAKGISDITTQLDIVNSRIAETVALQKQAATQWGSDYFAGIISNLSKERDGLQALNADLVKIGQTLTQNNENSKTNIAQEELQKLSAEAQRDLETNLANIKLRESAEHLAFVSGEKDAADWAVAQKNATDAATAAHELYAQRILDLSTQFGTADEKRAAAQKLATEQTLDEAKEMDTLAAATQRYHEATLKIVKDWEQLQVNSVTKSFEQAQKAAESLTQAQLALARSQEAVSKAQQTGNLDAQKSAIEQLAAIGIISEEEKANRLKQLYAQEEADALASLQKLLNVEQAAVTQGQAHLAEVQASGDAAKIAEAQAYLDKLVTAYNLSYAKLITTQTQYDSKSMALQTQMLKSASASWDGFFKALLAGSLRSGQAIQIMGGLIAQGIGQSVAAAVGGSQSFGQALEGLVKATLASLAGVAVTHVIEEVAKAASDFATAATMAADPFTAALAPGFIASAHAHLAAAAEWGVIGGGAAVAGAAIPTGSASSGGSNAATPNTGKTTSAATTAQQQPVQTTNVAHLSGGGLFSKRTMAVIADAADGGDQREAVLPLGRDTSAIDEIAGRLQERMGGGSSGTTINNNFKGSLISHAQLMRNLSRDIAKGKGRLSVSNTRRLTRRG